ncbi:hypothetical protein NB311A_11267 [Nitrobacter sp. Nb-311A]|nr:hypothetical protein NB311A_11267 [Nitrobacter sp. Nb-311A]
MPSISMANGPHHKLLQASGGSRKRGGAASGAILRTA